MGDIDMSSNLEIELNAARERNNTLESTISYLQSQEVILNDQLEEANNNLNIYKKTLDDIIEKTCGNEYNFENTQHQKANWSVEDQKRFIIDTVKFKLLTLYKKLLTVQQENEKFKSTPAHQENYQSSSISYTMSSTFANKAINIVNTNNTDNIEEKAIIETPQDNSALEQAKNDINNIVGIKKNEIIANSNIQTPKGSVIKPRQINTGPINDINNIKNENSEEDNSSRDLEFSEEPSEIKKVEPLSSANRFFNRKPKGFEAVNTFQAQGNEFTKLNNIHKQIILGIGATGEFLRTRIVAMLMDSGITENKKSAIYNGINYLEENKIIEKIDDEINIGSGRPSIAFKLTDVGKQKYREITLEDNGEEKEPVNTMFNSFESIAKSAEHGEFIRKVEEQLIASGYKTTTNEQEMRLKTIDGGASICDILAIKNGKIFRIEVECANYSPMKMTDKIRKILEVNENKILFICKNMTAKKSVETAALVAIANKYGCISKKEFTNKHGGVWSILTYDEFVKEDDWPNKLLKF